MPFCVLWRRSFDIIHLLSPPSRAPANAVPGPCFFRHPTAEVRISVSTCHLCESSTQSVESILLKYYIKKCNLLVFVCPASLLLTTASLPRVAESRGCSPLRASHCGGLLTAVFALSRSHCALGCGLQELQLPGSRVQAQELRCSSAVASHSTGIFLTRGKEPVPASMGL